MALAASKIKNVYDWAIRDNPTAQVSRIPSDVIGCGGGKLYTGFTDMPERVPGFVSLKEKYKKTPEMVVDYVQGLGMKRAENTLYSNYTYSRSIYQFCG